MTQIAPHFQKNPAISKVFREIGLADELGSGMRNSYKYTRLYSGGEPTFTEDGDIFRIVIPLNAAATVTAGPDNELEEKRTNQTIVNGITIKQPREKVEDIVNFCIEAKSTKEILDHMGLKSRSCFRTNVLLPMVEAGLLKFTIPDTPNSPKQKYEKA